MCLVEGGLKMIRELRPEEIVYDFDIKDINLDNKKNYSIEYEDIYRKIKVGLNIDKEGYNIYIIDDFSKDKIKNIKNYIYSNMKNKELYDICYVVYDNIKTPKPLFLKAGYGKKLKSIVEKIKMFYYKITFEFYNGSYEGKELIIDSINNKKNELINKIMDLAKSKNFTLKAAQDGFIFIPVKTDGKSMSEEEYDLLSPEEKQNIMDKVSILKKSSNNVLDELKKIETSETEKIKIIMDKYYEIKTKDIKKEYRNEFSTNESAIEYLDYICKNIEKKIREIYSISYENDEKLIKEIIFKYSVNIMIDNSGRKKPPVIYEEDPSVINLLGNIEYENKDGSYVTDISLIKPGSILKSNGGCLILRINNLLSNPKAYYYLKKALLSGKVNLDYKRGYMEILSLNGLKPEPIKFNEKVILIGDYNTYNIMYNYDPDFKKVFKIKAEYKYIVDIDDYTKESFLRKVIYICKKQNLRPITDEGLREIAKFLSRKAENRNKLYIDDYELEKMLIISDNSAREKDADYIEVQDIENAVYSGDLIEKQVHEGYRQKQIFIDIEGKKIGQINALSILDTGYFSFGRPIKITCSCVKGDGHIIDVQRESNLSGKIHNKAINTISGYINNLIGGYSNLPVNFHISFEQIYGSVDGDSASVAEVLAIISSISKVKIRQNIAVTGSINQFGEVQPVGGVNEKIEGFFDICKIVGDANKKGIIIPEANKTSIALKNEVEDEISKGNFHIYTMKTVGDAAQILMGDNRMDYDDIINRAKRECRKYEIKQERHKKHS